MENLKDILKLLITPINKDIGDYTFPHAEILKKHNLKVSKKITVEQRKEFIKFIGNGWRDGWEDNMIDDNFFTLASHVKCRKIEELNFITRFQRIGFLLCQMYLQKQLNKICEI